MNICPHQPSWTFKPVDGAYLLYLEPNLRTFSLPGSQTVGTVPPVWILWALILVGGSTSAADGALTWLIRPGRRLSGESRLSLRSALLPAALTYKQMKEYVNRTAEDTSYMQRKSAAKPVRVIDPYIYLLPCTNCIFRWYKAVVRLWCSPSCCLYCSKKWNTSMIKSQEVLWQI